MEFVQIISEMTDGVKDSFGLANVSGDALPFPLALSRNGFVLFFLKYIYVHKQQKLGEITVKVTMKHEGERFAATVTEHTMWANKLHFLAIVLM